MATLARQLAFRILLDVARGGTTLADRLAGPDVERLDRRDRALLHELVLGVLRHRGMLDSVLRPLTSRPFEGLDLRVREALRLGAYQLLRTRVPPRAAVSESVDLVRQAAPRASGLANAVLRRLERDGPPPSPSPEDDPLAWLTTEGSLPTWLAERWLARLGPQAAVARARAFLDVPPVAFRLNPRVQDAPHRVREAGLEPRPLAVPGAWEATAGRAAELAAAGVLYVQDQGSQMVARLAAGRGLALDACAAPGGKTTLMADLAGDEGIVIAAEVSGARMPDLRRLIHRWGCRNVRLARADANRPPFRGPFDAVLLDAPCSGLGTIGRHPDIRWRVRPEDLETQSRRQAGLLAALAPLVGGGGVLVYSTCSSEPEENEEPVEAFLRANHGFRTAALPDWAGPFAEPPYLRTRPERDRGDSFFAAVLERS